jgi:hypothetical protein
MQSWKGQPVIHTAERRRPLHAVAKKVVTFVFKGETTSVLLLFSLRFSRLFLITAQNVCWTNEPVS